MVIYKRIARLFRSHVRADAKRLTALRVGDYVTVGRSALTWRILGLHLDEATLISGQSSRLRSEKISNLVFHSRVED